MLRPYLLSEYNFCPYFFLNLEALKTRAAKWQNEETNENKEDVAECTI